jgi:hypothetical protein
VYSYDVYWSGGTSALQQIIPIGGILGNTRAALIRPDVIDDSLWIGGFEDHWMDDDTKNIIFSPNATAGSGVIQVNRQRLTSAQFSILDDFFKPEMKGKWCADDPTVPGAGATFFSELVITKGADYVTRLLQDTDPVISRDRRKMAEDLIRGDLLACVGSDMNPFWLENIGTHVEEVQVSIGSIGPEYQDKIKINCCGTGKNKPGPDGFFSNGTGGPAILNHAPHPNAAKVFLNWVLGPDGQREYFTKQINSCGPRKDIVDMCRSEREKLVEGNAYVTFHRSSNLQYRSDGQNLATQVLSGQ